MKIEKITWTDYIKTVPAKHREGLTIVGEDLTNVEFTVDTDITGYFCGNGMYAGTIYLRTQNPPLNLSDKLITRKVGKEEMESVILPLVTDFASVFSLNAAKCLEGGFMAVEADKSKSYSQLYAAV